MGWARHVARMGDTINSYTILFGKPEDKASTGRFKCAREDNIKMDNKELGCVGVEWNYLAQDRAQRWPLVNTVISLWVT
jgi:hypothetical protein